jgi:broad specificity polyphosphatase/5'/3'-nucleotidase SurE
VFSLGDTEDDTDVAAIRNKYISVTPLQFDLTHHGMTKRWAGGGWKLR